MSSPGAEPDPYAVLGLDRGATDGEIRAAYRALVAKYHPDRHQGNPLEELASAKMAEINRAHEILSDSRRRAAFDGRAAGGGFGGPPSGAPPSPGRETSVRGDGGPGGHGGRRAIQVAALLSLIPLLLRFGGLIARAVAALVRQLLEGAALVRGTPFAAVAVLVAATILVAVAIRRRRRRRQSTSNDGA